MATIGVTKPPKSTLATPASAPSAAVLPSNPPVATAGTKPPSKPMMPARTLAKPPVATARPSRTFTIKPWVDSGQGQKLMVYGPSGIGKTSLAATAPGAIFIGLDDGGRKIRNPITGNAVLAVEGIETFHDLRDALRQTDLFAPGSTCVIDTVTKAEVLAEQYTFESVKIDDHGHRANSLEDYGWGKGYRFLTETMRLLLTDLDGLIRRGVHVLLLAQQGQATVANLEGVDYLQDGPKLYFAKNGTGVRSEFCEWCDHIFKIGHQSIAVTKANKLATKGKVSGSTERAIFTEPELYFLAKNRMNGTIPPVVSFETPADRSIWQFVFEGATVS